MPSPRRTLAIRSRLRPGARARASGILLALALTLSAVLPAAADSAGPATLHLSFDDFGFLEQDFVARGGHKSIEERGLTLEEGRFGTGLRMNLTPHIDLRDEMSGGDLDEVVAVIFRTWRHREHWTVDNQPFLWGAGRFNTGSGAVAFWVRGALTEGELFNQSAMAWGRAEKHLLAITAGADQRLAAHLVDARYVRHEIRSKEKWDPDRWNHVVLNWDKARGLELIVNGETAASSWGRDAWWETALPGLFHLPMPHVVYDELHAFSRPLEREEIEALARTNTPPASGETTARTRRDRDRLARAFGLGPDSDLPVLEPLDAGRVLAFTEIVPAFVGEENIPAYFCRDGRYELAWPHPQDVFTPIPGDAAHQAERLDVDPGEGAVFNYLTLEGHFSEIPAALTDLRRDEEGLFEGEVFLDLPRDERFFFAATLPREAHGPFHLPFLQGYGAPPGFEGDLRLPLTGRTRVHELGLFDVTLQPYSPDPAEETAFYLRRGGRLEPRYDLALRTQHGLGERETLFAYRTPPAGDPEWMETGYLNRIHLVTAPVTGQTCAGAILLDLQVRTRTREDLLVVRLRDPGLPHRVWTHAEVKLRGFDGEGGRLRLLLDPPPLILPAGDRIWLDAASHDNARIRIGGEPASRIVLRRAPLEASEAAYESKGLMPVVAEATKAHYRPWTFERIPPDLDNPHTLGGHFDSVMPALAVSRVRPRSVIAQDYLDMAGVLPQARKAYGLAVPPDASFSPDRVPEGVPPWAWLQQKAKAFRLRVIDWMVRNQNSDGQLGEGWNDDVFLLVGRYDVPLDGHLGARRMFLRLFEGLDRTNMLGGGRVRIAPMDQFHTEDLYSTRFHSVLFELGDPHIVRRALQTAWHLGKPDRTPRYYFNGEPFLYDYNVLCWYWGTGPRHAYRSPPEGQVMGSLTHYYKQNDDLRFRRYTEAWNARRGGEQMITGMVLGGWGHSTRNPNSDDLSITLSWPEGGGQDLAQWVTWADSTGLECRLFSFDPLPRKVTARLYRIDPGAFEITLHESEEGTAGQLLWSRRQELQRYDTVTLEVPPAREVILGVRLVDPAPGDRLLPDLAVAAYDCERSGSTLRVRVSNVGAKPSPPARLVVRSAEGAVLAAAEGAVLAAAEVPPIPAPTDFVERSTWVEVAGLPPAGGLVVTVDPGDGVRELYRGNNRAVVGGGR